MEHHINRMPDSDILTSKPSSKCYANTVSLIYSAVHHVKLN